MGSAGCHARASGATARGRGLPRCPGRARLEGAQKRHEIALLVVIETNLETRVEVIDDAAEITRLPVVEVGGPGGQAAQRRRPEGPEVAPLSGAEAAPEVADL